MGTASEQFSNDCGRRWILVQRPLLLHGQIKWVEWSLLVETTLIYILVAF